MDDTQDEAIRYGLYVKYLIQLCKEEGFDALLDFLSREEDLSAQTGLAYLVRLHAMID